MKKIGFVKTISVGLDKETADITDKLEQRSFKIATLVRLLIRKHAKEYLKSG